VPYRRIYGVDEPHRLPWQVNDGKRSPHLPEGVPYGLVGTSSLYKRESFPNGIVPEGSVTATYAGKRSSHTMVPDAFFVPNSASTMNWVTQGADAGLYDNEDIHAIRIVVTEPTTDTQHGHRLYYNHASERLRILGEIPVRKFDRGSKGSEQPLDPDGNPDTSFLAKVPADVAWTFQTLDKHGMVLNMAQTWHQVRPGEVRTNCGGCHAHSQKPTLFEQTAAAKPDYELFDLTKETPVLTTARNDQSGKKWDASAETGLRFEKGIKNVEYLRDVKPILERSCIACHTQKHGKPAGNLVLDDDTTMISPPPNLGLPHWPGTYFRLAVDNSGKFGHKPLRFSYGQLNASRYVRMFQSRRSLLIWKIFGKRTDGWTNDDYPSENVPGDSSTLTWKGKPVDANTHYPYADLDYTGSIMPPPEAVAGNYLGPDGSKIKVAPLTDEDQLTLVRWIDLGCPLDLDYKSPQQRGHGWMLDDNRPTLTLTYPRPGTNTELTRILIGMHDYGTGLDLDSLRVVADFPLDGIRAGDNLAPRFKAKTPGVWELKPGEPHSRLTKGMLTISIEDRQGNVSRIERTFSVGDAKR
jgi:hypothetical protein